MFDGRTRRGKDRKKLGSVEVEELSPSKGRSSSRTCTFFHKGHQKKMITTSNPSTLQDFFTYWWPTGWSSYSEISNRTMVPRDLLKAC